MTTTFAELDRPTVVVTPGAETSITLTVRNDSDIVEGYEFEVLGECAPWTTVEPTRLSLYPATTGSVTILFRPPRSPDVTAGEKPLGIRVMPVERPETGTVSESTVVVEPYLWTEAELVPRRRRAWRSARYVVSVNNLGNTSVNVSLAAAETEARLRFLFPTAIPPVEPGATEPVRVRARARKLIWFGKPVTRALRIHASAVAVFESDPPLTEQHDLDGEMVQLPLLPRWLLALLAALLALIIAWFALVRPTIKSAATEAAEKAAQTAANQPPPAGGGAPAQPGGGGGGTPQGGGGGGGSAGSSQAPAPTSQQSSATIEVRTNPGGTGKKAYTVPDGKKFRITDILLANPQGDEGLLTVVFGQQTITTIALETFRNQDYHWVTPIDVPAGTAVTATVTCSKPGTPATGVQARNCLQLLNVSGTLVD